MHKNGTLLEKARKSILCDEISQVSAQENIDSKTLLGLVARGAVVVPKNKKREFSPIGIGQDLRTKINANIGTSPDNCNEKTELNKMKVAVDAGADTLMDLSTAGNLFHIRKTILEHCTVPLGTVPIYSVAAALFRKGKTITKLSPDMLFDEIERQCEQGVDFITVHCGVTQAVLEHLETQQRLLGIVSRGGSMLAGWMRYHNRENPLYEHYDRLLEIAHTYDVTLSLGDGLRPGAIKDASDRAQIGELIAIGNLAQRAYEKGVQVIIEGPGHVPLSQITENIKLEKSLCCGAPFYVLGPLPTDIAPGYDHITAAIGGSLAAAAGADYLCYVTPAEHLALPTLEDVREGVIACKIAAHIGDIEKGVAGAVERDHEISKYRKELNWDGIYKMSIDPQKAIKRRQESKAYDKDICTMCGEFCAVRASNLAFSKQDTADGN